jgi:hypothetical protein
MSNGGHRCFYNHLIPKLGLANAIFDGLRGQDPVYF